MQGLNDLDPNAQGRDLHRRVATCAAKHLLDKELCINSRSMSGVLVHLIQRAAFRDLISGIKRGDYNF